MLAKLFWLKRGPNEMFFHVLDESRQILLKKVVKDLPVQNSYLAGGTALALMMGHRTSIDFDWFTPVQFKPEVLVDRLSKIGNIKIAETSSGTFHGWLEGIKVTWLHYPNPLLQNLVHSEELQGFQLASMLDIALMKWAAISDRGSRKDFIDLYFLCKNGISLDALPPLLPKKFPNANINYYHMIKSLAYFDDAEREPSLNMIQPIDWSEVKAFFEEEQKSLLEDFLKNIN